MLYMAVMIMVVLPLFLIIGIRMINESSFKNRPIGWILKAIFALFAGLGILSLVILIIDTVQSAN